MLKRALGVIVCVFLWVPGYAQTLGTITGEVKDTSGAVIPGATVTAQNVATNAVRIQNSNEAGAFTFPAMPPGDYMVKAELQGFKTAQNKVELHVEQSVRVSFTPRGRRDYRNHGGDGGTSPLIPTENATIGTVIDNRRIVELPLNGRNYLSLIAASPNVSVGFAGAGQAGDRQGGSRSVQQYSIAGQRREFNYFTLDGVDNTDVNFNTYIFLPSVDALEEFKVQTGIYSAEFGRAAGQVNVVTKSGSNAFPRDGVRVPPQRQVRLAHLRLHARPGRRTQTRLPVESVPASRRPARWPGTACSSCRTSRASRTTRRSSTTSRCPRRRCGRGISRPSPRRCSIRRPAPSPAASAAARRSRATASRPTGSIPSRRSCWSSIRSRTRRARPRTTSPQVDRVIDRKQYTQRMDFVQSSALNWMGRYSWSHDDEVTPALKLNGSKLLNTVHQLMIGNTYTVSPTVLNEFRFGYNSFFNTFGRELAFVRDVVDELGIPGVSAGTPESWGIPSVGISGYAGSATTRKAPTPTGTRCSSSPTTCPGSAARTRSRRAQPSGSISTTRWAISSRAVRSRSTGGPPARRSATRQRAPPRSRTCCWATCAPSESAVALARTEFRSISQAYYFTDTWRMRENMTLDLGIRYEYVPPWLDEGGTLINAFLPFRDTGLPVADLSRHPVLVRIGEGDFYEDSPIRFAPNIQTARDGRLGGRLVNDDKKNFAPRVGWAWTPSANWSVRAGAGVFYMQDTGNPRFDMARNAAGRRQDVSDPLLLNLNWNAPFAGAGSNVCGVQPPLVCVQNHYVLGNMYDRKTPYMVQYVFNVQRELDRNTAVRDRLPRVPQQAPRADVRRQRGHPWARPPHGPAAVPGVHQGPGDRQRRRGQVQLDGDEADAAAQPWVLRARRLHAGEVRGQRQRHSRAERRRAVPAEQQLLRVRVGAVDLRRPAPVRHDVALRAAVRARQAVGKQRRLAGAILGGWQVSAIVNKSSGFPRDAAVGVDVPNTGAQTYRPNLVSGQDPNDGPRTVQQWFNTAAFARPDAFTYGNAGRNIVIGPGIFNTDLAILKNIVFGGGKSVQLRLEAFNLFNKPIWGDPDMNMSSSTYGRITHHALADARAAARREIRVLSTMTTGLQACRPDARRD